MAALVFPYAVAPNRSYAMTRIFISALLSVLITSFTGYGLHRISLDHAEAQYEKELKKQSDTLTKQCEAEKDRTEKISHDYQKKLADLNARYAAADKLLDRSACLRLRSAPASRRNGSPGANKPAGPILGGDLYIDGATALSLIHEGARYQEQLRACQAGQVR